MPTHLPAVLGLAVALAAPVAFAQKHDSVERGRDLLVQYRCGSCHTIPGVPAARGQVGPPLTGWGQRSYIAGRMANRPDVLVRWIVAPQSLVPGTLMPAMGVTPADAQAMADYLFSLE